MRSRQAPKKDKAEDDEDTKALKAKQQADAKAMKDAREKGASWRSRRARWADGGVYSAQG
jgi:hypothetical protein